MPPGEETIVCVEGGVEQVLTIELLKERDFKQVCGCLGIAGMFGADMLKALNGAGVVEVVKVAEGFVDLRIVVHGIGVAGGPCRGGKAQPCGKTHNTPHDLSHTNGSPFLI